MADMNTLFRKLEAYIRRNRQGATNVSDGKIFYSMRPVILSDHMPMPSDSNHPQNLLQNWFEEKTEASFKEVLLGYIDDKFDGNDAEVYKRAGMDRKLFSKIRTSDTYVPNKTNVAALILALRLTEDEAEALLEAAGYSLAYNRLFDLTIRFCIVNKIYDLMKVNELFYHVGLKTVY